MDATNLESLIPAVPAEGEQPEETAETNEVEAAEHKELEVPDDTEQQEESEDTGSEEDSEAEADEQEEQKATGAIDWAKVNPDDIPQDVIERTTAHRGVIRDLIETRRRNRQAEGEDRDEDGREDRRRRDDEDNDPDPLAGLDEDEPLTAGQIRQHREWQERKQQKKDEQRQKQEATKAEKVRAEQNQRRFEKLMAEVDSTAPKGLDVATVIREGAAWLAANKPHLARAASESDDPAREYYELSLAYVPTIRARAEAAKTAELLGKVKGGVKPQGSAGQQRRAGSVTIEKAVRENLDLLVPDPPE
jgi:hypothetical protein